MQMKHYSSSEKAMLQSRTALVARRKYNTDKINKKLSSIYRIKPSTGFLPLHLLSSFNSRNSTCFSSSTLSERLTENPSGVEYHSWTYAKFQPSAGLPKSWHIPRRGLPQSTDDDDETNLFSNQNGFSSRDERTERNKTRRTPIFLSYFFYANRRSEMHP